MFEKPTQEGIKWAMNEGWSREHAERGYDIFDHDGTGLLEINRIDAVYVGFDDGFTAVDDEDCAREAERTGFCKIIPVEELPENFEINGDSARWFGWVDTEENRKAIADYCERMDYRNHICVECKYCMYTLCKQGFDKLACHNEDGRGFRYEDAEACEHFEESED